MHDISFIPPAGHGPLGGANRLAPGPVSVNGVNGAHKTQDAPLAAPDRVELSQVARFLDRIRQLPEVRLDRVQSVRQAIEAGSYETDDKIEIALDRLVEDLAE